MLKKDGDEVPLSEREAALIEQIAKRDGITFDEAATQLAKRAIERVSKQVTGKGPGKVYQMRSKK